MSSFVWEMPGKGEAQKVLKEYLDGVCCYSCGKAYTPGEIWDEWRKVATVSPQAGIMRQQHRGVKFEITFRCYCLSCQTG